ncbi:hypothetical protein ABFB09_05180 [Dehalogenimonas sp. THU2]|uniref:hypothetical protein n=1 Tax=Dehalogenimonas sp. THU2 TaxID=3151121 RepID=UPI003218B2C1
MKFLKIAILLAIIVVVALSFQGVQPFADVKNNVVAWFDDTVSSNSLDSNKPNGTYTQTLLGYEVTITFSGNTFTIIDSIYGKRVYTYELGIDATTGEYNSITLTDPATGKTGQHSFKYLKDVNGVRYNGATYYK